MKIFFKRKARHAAASFGGNGRVYDASRRSALRADVPGGFPTDAFLELDEHAQRELVRRVRYLAKNDGVARELVNCMQIYAVGDGITPQASTASDAWNAAAEEYFASWARFPEVTGKFTFAKLQKFVCRAFDVDGEIFAVKTEIDGVPKLQLVETQRVPLLSDEQWTSGVRLDELGRPVAYRFDVGDGKFVSVPADSVIHAFIAQTPFDVRGVPWLQHSVNNLIDATEFLALEKHAGKQSLELALVYKSDNPDKFDEDDSGLPSAASDPAEERTGAKSIYEVTGGKAVVLGTNEDVKTLMPARPSEAVVNFTKAVHRLSCDGAIPYEFALDSSTVGGAGVRLVVAKAARYFSERQTEIIDKFLDPVWKFVVGHAVASGALPAEPGWDRVEWVTPRSLTVDAGRDAAQERENVKSGLKTLTDYLAESGEDVRKFLRRRALEIRLRDEEAARAGVAPEQIFKTND